MKTVYVNAILNFSFKVEDNISEDEIDNMVDDKIAEWDGLFDDITIEVVD